MLRVRLPSVLLMKQQERWKCLLCGRDKFTQKQAHRCVGGFRKRRIKWQKMECRCGETGSTRNAQTGVVMKALLEYLCSRPEPGTPPIVQQAMERMRDKFSRPPEPSMTQEEFDALNHFEKCIMTCNMPKCGKVVSTHGMLCVEHNAMTM